MKSKKGRRHALSVFLLAALSGCGGGANKSGESFSPTSPKQTTAVAGGAESSLPASAEQAAAVEGGSTKPVGAQEVARVIDLRTFPRMEGAEVEEQSLGEVRYRAPGTVQQAIDFCVKKLTEAGWRESAEARYSHKADGQETLYVVFSKQGYLLSAVAWHADQGLGVSLTNYGNFDTRTLPRMKDAVVKPLGPKSFPLYTTTTYTTEATIKEVMDFVEKEMRAPGWQEYVHQLRSNRRSPGSLYFRNRATRLAVFAYKDHEDPSKTTVSYSAGVLTDDIPTLPDATSLRLEDGTIFQMRYETAAAFEPVIDFYKKELPLLGWKFRAGAGLIKKDSAFIYFDGPNKDYLSVDLAPAAGGKTLVKFAHFPPEAVTESIRKSAAKPKPAKTSPSSPDKPADLADQAVEAFVKKRGGFVHRNQQLPGQPLYSVSLGMSDCKDSDLKRLAGLKSLSSLTLYRTAVTDAGLKEIGGMKSLQSLDLGATKITDAGLKELAGLTALEQLTLNSTEITGAGLSDLANLKLRSLQLARAKVTDDGLKGLGGLKSLRQLDLSDAKITGSGLKELSGLASLEILNLNSSTITDASLSGLPKNLHILSLYRTKVTDAGLKGLAGMESLENLDLSHTPVTGIGLKELTGRKSLQRLELTSTKVSDEGLKGLAGFTSLEMLDLGGTNVTDAGLKELYGLTSLQSLNLERTRVTKEGLEKLRKALPECSIRN